MFIRPGRAVLVLGRRERKPESRRCRQVWATRVRRRRLSSLSTTNGFNPMNDTSRTDADDIRVCIHEASHAAIGRRWSELGGMTAVAGDGFSGRCWGPEFESRFLNEHDSAPSLCEQIAPLMPMPGESRADVADIFLHVHNRVVELVAGTEGERLFLDGGPWFAADDERQAFSYASLITSSPASAAAFIEFARVEAIGLLGDSEHIVRALAEELRIKRTMDGSAIDHCIERAVALRSIEIEHQRRAAWHARELNAAQFNSLG
jgi:hypothetical protein